MFHISASVNRESILLQGLDWRRMGEAPGLFGNREPELPVIWVCEEDRLWLVGSDAPFQVDVWAVNCEGLTIHVDEGSQLCYLTDPVPGDRLRLVRRAVWPSAL